jgi:hypothetical protein
MIATKIPLKVNRKPPSFINNRISITETSDKDSSPEMSGLKAFPMFTDYVSAITDIKKKS